MDSKLKKIEENIVRFAKSVQSTRQQLGLLETENERLKEFSESQNEKIDRLEKYNETLTNENSKLSDRLTFLESENANQQKLVENHTKTFISKIEEMLALLDMEKVQEVIKDEVKKITQPLHDKTDKKLRELEKANDFTNLNAILENAEDNENNEQDLDEMINGNGSNSSPETKRPRNE